MRLYLAALISARIFRYCLLAEEFPTSKHFARNSDALLRPDQSVKFIKSNSLVHAMELAFDPTERDLNSSPVTQRTITDTPIVAIDRRSNQDPRRAALELEMKVQQK